MHGNQRILNPFSRRDFLKTAAAATTGLSASLMTSGNFAYAGGSDVIRVGLVGAGGRGSGAARDCFESAEGVEIVAIGDLFRDRIEERREDLKEALGEGYKVTDDRIFSGFDAYKHVIDSDVDLVILATPPGFRPIHLRYAVEAGKHVFVEKPCAVDPSGVRSVIESGEMAMAKGLSIVAGTQYRRQPSYVEAIKRIHEGRIGEVVSAAEYYLTGPIWLRPRKPGMSDMEWQCRNWYYFTWLSGDHIVEQFVHNLDTIDWVMQGPPVSAIGSGGRQARVDPSFGHIWDNFNIQYTYANEVRVTAMCRQMENCYTNVSNRIIGTEGVADIHPDFSRLTSHKGKVIFEHPEKGNNPYVQEHTDLIASIRAGQPLNEAKHVAYSTMTAILGREACYTGQEVTWEQLMKSEQKLVPDTFAFGSLAEAPVAVPGITQVERLFS
ncbi:MAG: Gfo/Idh/MocA family oxidoreductase [Rhodothermales bacterium]|nr:Gfo/Idh/MocA family oxidoreductase [Rhodothermales bacterium]